MSIKFDDDPTIYGYWQVLCASGTYLTWAEAARRRGHHDFYHNRL